MPEVTVGLIVWLLLNGVLWGIGLAFILAGLRDLDRESWAVGLASVAIGILTIVYRSEIREFFDQLARVFLESGSS